VFTVRLIRTYSSGKLRSRILLTTLLDERRYKWRDLVRLYLQRWRIELPGKWKTTGRRQQMFGHSAAVGGQSSQKRRIGPRPPIPEVLYVCDPERPPRK
jgi:hypothetical protein